MNKRSLIKIFSPDTHTRGSQVGSGRGVQDDVLVFAGLADSGVHKMPLGVGLCVASLALVFVIDRNGSLLSSG
jgi:hypothetical protein